MLKDRRCYLQGGAVSLRIQEIRSVQLCGGQRRLTMRFFSVDLSRGLCFSQVDNGICKGSGKMMLLVTRSDCCCSAGVAWGSQCILCPQVNSGMK